MAYLTDAEYLSRYGAAETVRLTDETRSGDYDSEKLGSAISYAGDIVDAYLGGRYIVPLVEAPAIVKHITAALAREILHTSRPTEAVTQEADRARKQLEGMSKGVLTLTVPLSAEPAATTGSSSSATSGDGSEPVFTDNKLAPYQSMSGYLGGNWRY